MYFKKRKGMTKRPVRKHKAAKRAHQKVVTETKLTKHIKQIWTDRYRCKVSNCIVYNTAGSGGAVNAFGIGGNFLHGASTIVAGAAQLTAGNFTLNNIVSGIGALLANGANGTPPYLGYRIHSSSVVIECAPQINTTTNSYSLDLGIVVVPMTENCALLQSNVASLGYPQMIEQAYAKHITISGVAVNKLPKIKHWMSTRKMFGLKYASEIESGEYDQSIGSVPNNQWFWYVFTDPSSTSVTTPATFTVVATYDIEFFDRSPDIPITM